MRIIVCSDSHGNARRLEEIVEAHRREAEAFIHLGDGLYELALMRKKHPDLPFFYVRGNCDWGDPLPDAEDTQIRSFGEAKILYTHGHRYNVKTDTGPLLTAGRSAGAKVILYGHTHVACVDFQDGIYLLNPGSCSQGRGGPPGYMVLDITGQGIVPVLRAFST